MKRVYVLLGGMIGIDGSLFSRGMADLATRIARLPDVQCTTHYWTSYWSVVQSIARQPPAAKIILVGYSGGGSRATWVTRYVPRNIALVIGYDPSPVSSMMPFRGNVARAICYHNTVHLGLGGGRFTGKGDIHTIEIDMPHLAVDYTEALHLQTLQEIAAS